MLALVTRVLALAGSSLSPMLCFLNIVFVFFSEGGGVGVFDSLDMVSGYLEAGKIHWKKMLVESWQVLY